MKKTISALAVFLLASTSIWAQVPGSFSYQSVIRDVSNNLVANQSVGVQLSILQGSITGTAVYVETHALSTNDNGLVSLEIGTGAVSVGSSINDVNWASGPFFLKSETDPTGGTNYTILATSQLISVPYAMLAGNIALADNNGGVWQLTVDESGNLSTYPTVYNPSNPPVLELREVYYDAPSGDDQLEWVKIYNPNNFTVDLSEYRIANAGTAYQEVLQLSGNIGAQECMVVGGPVSNSDNGNPVYDLAVDFNPDLQNSGTTADAVAIFYGDVSAPGNLPIDVVVYGSTNDNNLVGPDGQPAAVDVGDVLSGSSLLKVGSVWQENVTPTPNTCP